MVGGLHHALAAFLLGQTWYPSYRRLGGPQGRSAQVRKISSPPGFSPWPTQHIASCYTDWTRMSMENGHNYKMFCCDCSPFRPFNWKNRHTVYTKTVYCTSYTWVRASWIKFNNCPTRCDLFSLLYFCRQLYTFQVLTNKIPHSS
jgi:hypothetical protein